MLRSVQISRKCTILGNLRTITQERKKETRPITPYFHQKVWGLTFCDIHFCIWKMSEFVFMGSHLWSILVCKIHKFWRWNLWDQNFVPLHSGNIHIKESKKPYFYFFNWVENEICLISWTNSITNPKQLESIRFVITQTKCFSFYPLDFRF